jgi:hypothetical protein
MDQATGRAPVRGGPAALTVLVIGIHMTGTRWGPQGWIVVGLAGMVVIAVLGAAVSGRRAGAISRALPLEEGSISTALGRRLHDPVLTLSLSFRTALFLGVVFVMTTEPSGVGALAAVGVALGLGLAATLSVWGGVRRPARMAGSER